MNKNRKQNHRISSMSDMTGIAGSSGSSRNSRIVGIFGISGNSIISGIRAIFLAFVLCTVQTGPVLAEVEMGDVTFPIQDSSAAQDSVLTGNINVELLSIALPAGGLEFTVDTLREFSLDNPGGQFEDMDLPIMNRSKVPIQVEVSQVAEVTKGDLHFEDKFSDQEKQSFQLVDQISKVGPMGTAILVLGVSGQIYSTAQEFERQAFLPGRTGSIYITEIPAEETVHLKLYGKVAPDFYGQYQFTVRPTLKISAAR